MYAFLPNSFDGSFRSSTAVGLPRHTPESTSIELPSLKAPRSKTSERSGGGKRALYRFSEALKGVQSGSTSDLAFVDFSYCRFAFLYAGLEGSCKSAEGDIFGQRALSSSETNTLKLVIAYFFDIAERPRSPIRKLHVPQTVKHSFSTSFSGPAYVAMASSFPAYTSRPFL